MRCQVAVSAALYAQLSATPCRVYGSDLRIRVLATGLATYPDVTVVCGALERDPQSHVTVINPTLLVEVLSDRTEEFDRGEKFAHYKKIPSLREYVLVSQSERRLEVWRVGEGGCWHHDEARSGDRLSLGFVSCILDVDALYRPAEDRTS